MSTNGGQRTISSRTWPRTSGRKAATNSRACCGVLYIFQLAAISFFLMTGRRARSASTGNRWPEPGPPQCKYCGCTDQRVQIEPGEPSGGDAKTRPPSGPQFVLQASPDNQTLLSKWKGS